LTALREGDPAGARASCTGRSEVMGRIMLAELVRRRVLGPGSNTLALPNTL
jgi:hypothetical protein